LTKTEIITSNDSITVNKTLYPQDLAVKTAAEQTLIDQYRIATPIESVSLLVKDEDNEKIISKKRTEYKDWGNNIVLPKAIQTLKGEPTDTNIPEDRIIYHDYDNKGNPTEVSKKDGSKMYYVWGYNQTQPIAKIEGYTEVQLANVQGLINTARSASNNDSSRCLQSDNCNETTLRYALNAIRLNWNMTNAQVTTFTYDPLIGVTSITDPRGETIYYNYDNFNRLKFVKDAEGNILSKNEYNYKN
jgi:YD repeat-containing protein